MWEWLIPMTANFSLGLTVFAGVCALEVRGSIDMAAADPAMSLRKSRRPTRGFVMLAAPEKAGAAGLHGRPPARKKRKSVHDARCASSLIAAGRTPMIQADPQLVKPISFTASVRMRCQPESAAAAPLSRP